MPLLSKWICDFFPLNWQKSSDALFLPCFSWIYKQTNKRSRRRGFVQWVSKRQLLTSTTECKWEGHVAPVIDRCSLIEKGVGFFTAFLWDSALRESRLSTRFWARLVLVANCILAAEMGRERETEGEREDGWDGERGGAFHNNSHRVKRFHNHYLPMKNAKASE